MENREVKLEVNDLKISFRTSNGKVQAVRDISFKLYKGETLAIVGESGSGKSVTTRAVLGILAAAFILPLPGRGDCRVGCSRCVPVPEGQVPAFHQVSPIFPQSRVLRGLRRVPGLKKAHNRLCGRGCRVS